MRVEADAFLFARQTWPIPTLFPVSGSLLEALLVCSMILFVVRRSSTSVGTSAASCILAISNPKFAVVIRRACTLRRVSFLSTIVSYLLTGSERSLMVAMQVRIASRMIDYTFMYCSDLLWHVF